MRFDDYLQELFGSYLSEISNDSLTKLKGDYDKLFIWQNRANIAQKDGNKEEYEKAMENVQELSAKFTLEVKKIKKELGIEEDITSQHRM